MVCGSLLLQRHATDGRLRAVLQQGQQGAHRPHDGDALQRPAGETRSIYLGVTPTESAMRPGRPPQQKCKPRGAASGAAGEVCAGGGLAHAMLRWRRPSHVLRDMSRLSEGTVVLLVGGAPARALAGRAPLQGDGGPASCGVSGLRLAPPLTPGRRCGQNTSDTP